MVFAFQHPPSRRVRDTNALDFCRQQRYDYLEAQ